MLKEGRSVTEETTSSDKAHGGTEVEDVESDNDEAGGIHGTGEKEADVLEVQDDNMSFSFPLKRRRENDPTGRTKKV